jgi:hypothetical protein
VAFYTSFYTSFYPSFYTLCHPFFSCLCSANYYNDANLYNVESEIFKWVPSSSSWVLNTSIPTTSARRWDSFEDGGEFYLISTGYKANSGCSGGLARVVKYLKNSGEFSIVQSLAEGGHIDSTLFFDAASESWILTFVPYRKNDGGCSSDGNIRVYKWPKGGSCKFDVLHR